MNIDKIKGILKNKKIVSIAGLSIVAIIGLTMSGYMMIHNKNKVEANNQVVTVKKEKDNSEEKEVQEKLEELKKIDTSKLSEEDKKDVETKIAEIEKLIENKEYAKATTDIETLSTDINTKIEEVAKSEESKKEEENKEENKEVASNTTENSTSSSAVNTGSSNSSNTSSSSSVGSSNSSSSTTNNSASSSSNQVVQQPTTPVVEEKPVQSTPEPTPQPPVVETPTPAYPSVAEVKQRLISYGQSLGYVYNSTLEGSGFNAGGTSQMWGIGLGGNADCQTLFNGLSSLMVDNEFGITVVDLGNGYVEMSVWIR